MITIGCCEQVQLPRKEVVEGPSNEGTRVRCVKTNACTS